MTKIQQNASTTIPIFHLRPYPIIIISNIIKSSQISADVQLCRNLNTVLANASAEGRVPSSVYDVLYLENEAGYIIENLNPTADDMYYAWDEEKNQMIYIMSDLETVYYPEDYALTPGKCWITVGSADEATKVGNKGYNIALEKSIDEEITLTSVVSVNTLGFKCNSITMADGEHNVETAYLIGTFGTTKLSSASTSIVTSGSVNTLSVSGSASVTVGGSVSSFSAASGVSSTVSSSGTIKSVASGSQSTIVNKGVVQNNNGAGAVQGSNVTSRVITTKDAIESIRTQIAAGDTTFEGETIQLGADINLNGIAMTPISNMSREGITSASAVFKGTFDGQGHTIKNYSTSGFTITGLNAGTNSSTPYFGANKTKYNEAVYGLFGVVYDATIKNVNITVDIDLVLDDSYHYVGDSVGGIVGCAFGTVVFENCTVSGTIKGYDGVGGLLGRLKGGSCTFINCTNNADVTGVRKTGGFIGSSYNGAYAVTYNNCVNNGNITCLGVEKDAELGCWSGDKMMSDYPSDFTAAKCNLSGYYTASASNGEYASADFTTGANAAKNTVTIIGSFKNNGTIKVGNQNVGNGTYYNAATGKYTYK